MLKMLPKMDFVPRLGDFTAYVSYTVDGLLMLLAIDDVDCIGGRGLFFEVRDWLLSTYRSDSDVVVKSVDFEKPTDLTVYFDINYY